MKRIPLLLLLIALLIPLGGCRQERRREMESITRQVRSILELPSYEHVYREVIYLGEETSFLGIRTSDKRLLFSVDMRVQAGVRLDRGFILEPAGLDRIRVLLPTAEILSVDADEESIQQFFILERGGSITHTDFYDQIEVSKESIRRDAIDRGILDKAQENARVLIETVLRGAGYTEVEFVPREDPA